MAHRAKIEMSGQYIGKFQCKIGYGKATPTPRLWVGGLGPWTSLAALEREFDRFGAIRKIDYVKGDNHAYVLYDSLDAAQAACQEMRGFPLGGNNRRLRVDFSDDGPFSSYQSTSPRRFPREENDHFIPRRNDGEQMGRDLRELPLEPLQFYRGREREGNQWHNPGFDPVFDSHMDHGRAHLRDNWIPPERNRGRRIGMHDWNRNRRARRGDFEINVDIRKHPLDDYTNERIVNLERMPKYGSRILNTPERHSRDRTPFNLRGNRSPSREKFHDSRDHSSMGSYTKNSRNSQTSDDVSEHSEKSDKDIGRTRESSLEKSSGKGKEALSGLGQVRTIQELAKCFPVAWHGALVLKNSAFNTRMHIVSGDRTIVETLMQDSSTSMPSLRITQRLRLDQPKLEDVSRRMLTSGPNGHCLLIALPGSSLQVDDTSSTQQRPLRNLVSYLKQKEAAGVIALPVNVPKEKDNLGVLYAFPPCQFSHELVVRIASTLGSEPSKEDHLVIAVVRGLS